MNNISAKYIKTNYNIKNAMIDLLQDKSFSEINITELCLKATINRSTFYSHYKNTYELFNEIISDIRLLLVEYYEVYIEGITNNKPNIGLDDMSIINKDLILPFLEFTKNNIVFFKIYLSNPQYFNEYYIINRYSKNYPCDDTKLKIKNNYKLSFYYSGIKTIIKYWINTGLKETSEEIANIILESIQ